MSDAEALQDIKLCMCVSIISVTNTIARSKPMGCASKTYPPSPNSKGGFETRQTNRGSDY